MNFKLTEGEGIEHEATLLCSSAEHEKPHFGASITANDGGITITMLDEMKIGDRVN